MFLRIFEFWQNTKRTIAKIGKWTFFICARRTLRWNPNIKTFTAQIYGKTEFFFGTWCLHWAMVDELRKPLNDTFLIRPIVVYSQYTCQRTIKKLSAKLAMDIEIFLNILVSIINQFVVDYVKRGTIKIQYILASLAVIDIFTDNLRSIISKLHL